MIKEQAGASSGLIALMFFVGILRGETLLDFHLPFN